MWKQFGVISIKENKHKKKNITNLEKDGSQLALFLLNLQLRGGKRV